MSKHTRRTTTPDTGSVRDIYTMSPSEYAIFYTARGELTAYALACGYVQRRQLAPDFAVVLFKEHNTYVVYTPQHRHCFDTLAPARRAYHAAIQEATLC